LVTVRQCAAIFEAVKPLLDLRSTHCIIAETLLNRLDCFRFGISKLLAKLDAVPLLHALVILGEMQCDEHVLQHLTHYLLRGERRTGRGRKKIKHAHKGPPTTVIRFANLPSLFFPGINKVGYFLNRPLFTSHTP
jgi:hypothetical protein